MTYETDSGFDLVVYKHRISSDTVAIDSKDSSGAFQLIVKRREV